MPSFRRRASVIDADQVEEPTKKPEEAPAAGDALALAEEAEAEAAEAEAVAAAASARARALRLRRQAAAAEGDAPDSDVQTDASDVETTGTEVVAETGAEPETADALDDTPDDLDAAPARRRWAVRRIVKIAAVSLAILCTIALITVSVIMVILHRQEARLQQQNAEYAAAARQNVVTLMSLDYNKAQEDVQRIIDNSTGQFKDDFQLQAPDFVKVAQDSKVITEVNVNATAVDTMSDDQAVVLVAATSRVTNSAGAKQEPRSWRLTVSLQREGDQIKMSKVEFVP